MMDLQINRNFEAFEVYEKEHFQEMLCASEKARNLSFLKKANQNERKPIHKRQAHQVIEPVVQLEDCSIYPSFWLNPV